ncbi:MAG: Rieske 2Fe-2S domain-containing protein [Synechococcales bacterium]|nr:Rieske 2Fe-2S domain-containing protein [Synechococcales bacterium]
MPLNPFSRRRLLMIASGISSALGAIGLGRAAQAQKTADGFQTVVGPSSILDKQGKVLTDQVLIVRNKGKLIGVSPFCTHKNCVVNWDAKKQVFVCPCHEAEYSPEGKVLKGPAQLPLKRYEVKIQNNAFLIKPKG